jgi:hypothetical protein
MEGTMSDRPITQVRVLKQPHLHPEAIRVEVDCCHSTTGITQVPAPGGLELPTPALITAACFEHEARCGECDTSEAHAQGHAELREWTEEVWARVTAGSVRRHFHGRRN